MQHQNLNNLIKKDVTIENKNKTWKGTKYKKAIRSNVEFIQ